MGLNNRSKVLDDCHFGLRVLDKLSGFLRRHSVFFSLQLMVGHSFAGICDKLGDKLIARFATALGRQSQAQQLCKLLYAVVERVKQDRIAACERRCICSLESGHSFCGRSVVDLVHHSEQSCCDLCLVLSCSALSSVFFENDSLCLYLLGVENLNLCHPPVRGQQGFVLQAWDRPQQARSPPAVIVLLSSSSLLLSFRVPFALRFELLHGHDPDSCSTGAWAQNLQDPKGPAIS